LNRLVQPRRPAGAYRATDRSGALAAFLSFLFPGLGQAYLRRRRDALRFALPILIAIVLLVVAAVAAGGILRLGARVFNPTVAFGVAIVLVVVGVWWITAIVHAWWAGRHHGVASVAVVVVLSLTVVGVDVWGANQSWQLRNASIDFATGDPTIADNPTVLVTPTPTLPPPGQTPDPNATPTPTPTRPPDYVDPSDMPSDEPSPSIEPGPTPAIDITTLDAEDDGLLNVLLTGTDQGLPGHVGARTDTMVVISVNSATGDVLMFSFPRDLQRFPIYNGGTFGGKLNTFAGATKGYPDQFPEPGIKSLAYQIGFLLGVPVDYWANVNTNGFMDIVREVGGVTVCNEREISDSHLQFYLSPGLHRLGPEDALRFVRSRHGQPGGDFARARRQQEVLAALRKEMLKPENLLRIGDIASSLAAVVKTNFPTDQIDQLVDLANRVEAEPSGSWIFKNPQWATLETRRETGGRQVLTPRLDRIGALSVELFGEKSLYYGQVPAPSPDGSLEPSPTPSPDASVSPDVCGAQQ